MKMFLRLSVFVVLSITVLLASGTVYAERGLDWKW